MCYIFWGKVDKYISQFHGVRICPWVVIYTYIHSNFEYPLIQENRVFFKGDCITTNQCKLVHCCNSAVGVLDDEIVCTVCANVHCVVLLSVVYISNSCIPLLI